MTRADAIRILEETPEDELGDMLIELAVHHWMQEEGISEDELLALVSTVIEEQ